MKMRLLGVVLLLTFCWQSYASTEDPEKYCPCLPPRLCPRIFGLSPVDSKQIGSLPNCKDLTTVRCCGASLTIITEHLGTTTFDEDYLRLGKSPVYIPAKIQPIPIPENVMRQIEELSADDDSKKGQTSQTEAKNEETPTNPSLRDAEEMKNLRNIEDVISLKINSSTIEKTLTNNDVTTSNPATEKATESSDSNLENMTELNKMCLGCNESEVNSSFNTENDSNTEKYSQIDTNLMEDLSKVNGNSTDENVSNVNSKFVEEIANVNNSMTVGSSKSDNLTILSDSEQIVTDKESTIVSSNNRGDISDGTIVRSVERGENHADKSIAIIESQPYNVKTMRNFEMPEEVYIILPNEESGKMVYTEMNGTDNLYLQMDDSFKNITNDDDNNFVDQSNDIDDAGDDNDQIQNATNRQEVIEKHLDSIVFQNWENGTKSDVVDKKMSADKVEEGPSKTTQEMTTEAQSKRSKSQQIRHNLYTRKPNSSILLQSRNKITEMPSTTPVTTTTKKDESTVRREEIERISNMTRDQLASGSENVPVKKLPPPKFRETARPKDEDEDDGDDPERSPIKVPHFRHPPRMLKTVTTTKQTPAAKVQRTKITKGSKEDIDLVDDDDVDGDYDEDEEVEEGEETNNDEVVYEEEPRLVEPSESQSQSPSRGRRQQMARSRGGNVFRKPVTEEDMSVDTVEEERVAAMHEFKKVRGQTRFQQPLFENKKNSATRSGSRDVAAVEPESTKSSQKEEKPNPPILRARSRTRTDSTSIPETTALPRTTTTVLPRTTTTTLLPTTVPNIGEEKNPSTEQSLSFQNDYSQEETSKEPQAFDSGHKNDENVKQIEIYEGKKLTPVSKNLEQEVYTGRRLVEKKKNIEVSTAKNLNTEEKPDASEVYTGRKLVTTTKKPVIVTSTQDNVSTTEKIEKIKITKDRSEDKPSITDEINDKETRQQNGGLSLKNRQRPRKNRLQVTPHSIGNVNLVGQSIKTENHSTTTAKPQLTTQSPTEPKTIKGNFRGNFLRNKNKIVALESMIQEHILMDHTAIKSRMMQSFEESQMHVQKQVDDQHIVEEGGIGHSKEEGSRSQVLYNRDPLSKNVGDRQQFESFTDKDLESEGTEERQENRQPPSGFKPPTRMERGFVPVMVTENNLNVVGPIPNGFRHQNLKATSDFTEDGVPTTQLQLPEEMKPSKSFGEHKEVDFDNFSKAEIVNKSLTELVPPIIEAVFFRTNYDDAVEGYNESLMKYNEYIQMFFLHRPINFEKQEKNQEMESDLPQA